ETEGSPARSLLRAQSEDWEDVVASAIARELAQGTWNTPRQTGDLPISAPPRPPLDLFIYTSMADPAYTGDATVHLSVIYRRPPTSRLLPLRLRRLVAMAEFVFAEMA